MSNDFITPLLPILSFGSTKDSSLNTIDLPNYSISIPSTSTSTNSNSTLPVVDPSLINLNHVLQSVLKAKRITVLCGAGISCASGIPDFRSTEGLFASLKKQYPEANLSSGKDLFDASLFSSEANAAIFYTMISELKTMSDKAEPTAFHKFLKSLDDEGKLHRVYTQNIDGLEEKVGLSYGLGSKAPPTPRRRGSQSPTKSPTKPIIPTTTRTTRNSTPPSNSIPFDSTSTPPPRAPPIPKCIPLHGHLATLSCPHCSNTISITPHLPLLATGQTLPCPKCMTIEEARKAVGERSRGIGMMKPDVVLYGETHKEGERVGEITRKDLMGVRPDLLLVVGTSLKVPGTKLLVRELAKVIRPAWTWTKSEEEIIEDEDELPVASGSTSTSTTSTSNGEKKAPRRKLKPDKVSVIYLNFEFPKPSSEWKDVFDVWMRGDVQEFVTLLEEEKLLEEGRKLKKEVERIELIKRREEKEKKRIEKELLGLLNSSQVSVGESDATTSTKTTTTTQTTTKTTTTTTIKIAKVPKLKSTTTISKPKSIPKIKSTIGVGSLRKLPTKRNSKLVASSASTSKTKVEEDIEMNGTPEEEEELLNITSTNSGSSSSSSTRNKHPHTFSLNFPSSKPFIGNRAFGKGK